MMLVADQDARLTDASHAACRELGFERQELVRMSVPEIVVDRRLAETLYAEYLIAGQQHGTVTLRRKNGSTFDASYSATIRESPGGARHVSILIPDD